MIFFCIISLDLHEKFKKCFHCSNMAVAKSTNRYIILQYYIYIPAPAFGNQIIALIRIVAFPSCEHPFWLASDFHFSVFYVDFCHFKPEKVYLQMP